MTYEIPLTFSTLCTLSVRPIWVHAHGVAVNTMADPGRLSRPQKLDNGRTDVHVSCRIDKSNVSTVVDA